MTPYLTSQCAMEVYFNNICKTAAAALQSPICHPTPTALLLLSNSPFIRGETQTQGLWQRSPLWISFFKTFSGSARRKKKGGGGDTKKNIQFRNHITTITAKREKHITHLSAELFEEARRTSKAHFWFSFAHQHRRDWVVGVCNSLLKSSQC